MIVLKSKFLVCCILFSNCLNAQTVYEFILQYNTHVDPYNKLDSITKIEFKQSNSIYFKDETNSVTKNVKSIRNCIYHSNGKYTCDYSNTLGQNITESFTVPIEDGGNAVKIHLNLISTHSNRTFEFITKNDSIVVIEMRNSSKVIHQYTFKTKTKDLLQIKRINLENGQKTEAITTFLNYETIDSIIVPKKVKWQKHNSIVEIEIFCEKFEYMNYDINRN